MAGMEIVVTGDDRVVRALNDGANALGGNAMEMALVAGGLLIENAAKQKVPKKSGNLARSIHIGGHTFGSDGAVEDGSDIGGNSSTQIAVGTNVVYARRIEYGFSGADVLGRNYNQPPQPYLRPAFDEQRDAAIREVADALRDLLEIGDGLMADVNIDTEFLDAINGTALIGARVYPKRFPQSPTFPCATYVRISAVPERAFNRTLGQTRTRFQVDVWAQSHTQARQAAVQMKAAILAFYGTVVQVFGLDDANESDTVNPDNGLHQTSIDVVISHG